MSEFWSAWLASVWLILTGNGRIGNTADTGKVIRLRLSYRSTLRLSSAGGTIMETHRSYATEHTKGAENIIKLGAADFAD